MLVVIYVDFLPTNSILISGISGVELTKDVDFELKIDRVTLVASHRLRQRYRRYGFYKPLLKSDNGIDVDDVTNNFPTVALIRDSAPEKKVLRKCAPIIDAELCLLVASQLGINSRPSSKRIIAGTQGIETYRTFTSTPDTKEWQLKLNHEGQTSNLIIDARWVELSRRFLYQRAIRVVRGKTSFKSSWGKKIRQALILVGKSLTEPDINLALLKMIIALEVLTVERENGSISSEMPRHAYSLIGWVSDWETESYREKLKDIYGKRSNFVHNGEMNQIGPTDIAFVDKIVFNILYAICCNPAKLPEKSSLLELSRKIEAAEVLGINTKRYRPKQLEFINNSSWSTPKAWKNGQTIIDPET